MTVSDALPLRPSLSIVAARAADDAVLRMLLPPSLHLASVTRAARQYGATDAPPAWLAWRFDANGTRHFAGAAAIRLSTHGLSRCWVQVVDPQRRHGVGKALLKQLVDAASKMSLPGLRAATLVDTESGHAFALNSDWEQRVTLDEYRSSVAMVRDMMAPLLRRFERSGKIPAQVKLTPFSKIHDPNQQREIAKLLAAHIGGHFPTALKAVRGLAKPGQANIAERINRELSLALELEGDIIGAVTIRYVTEWSAYRTDAIVVRPDHRGGWANVMLRHEGAIRLLKDGRSADWVYRVRPDFRDTLKFTTRLGARHVRHLAMYVLPLSGKAEVAEVHGTTWDDLAEGDDVDMDE